MFASMSARPDTLLQCNSVGCTVHKRARGNLLGYTTAKWCTKSSLISKHCHDVTSQEAAQPDTWHHGNVLKSLWKCITRGVISKAEHFFWSPLHIHCDHEMNHGRIMKWIMVGIMWSWNGSW